MATADSSNESRAHEPVPAGRVDDDLPILVARLGADLLGLLDTKLSLIKLESIDVYVPVCSPVASLHDSLAMPLLAAHCEVLHVRPDTILQLDDKFQFFEAARQLQLAVPKSFLIVANFSWISILL